MLRLAAVLAAPPLEEARRRGVSTAYVGFTRTALTALETLFVVFYK